MKKIAFLTTAGLVLLLSLTLTSTAMADAGGTPHEGSQGIGNVGQSDVPAAPEPGILIMAASGLALGGGYIGWRRYKSSSKKNA